jgi:hypothetical protein
MAITVARIVTSTEPVIKGIIPNSSFWNETGFHILWNSSPKPGEPMKGKASLKRNKNISRTMIIEREPQLCRKYLINLALSLFLFNTIY